MFHHQLHLFFYLFPDDYSPLSPNIIVIQPPQEEKFELDLGLLTRAGKKSSSCFYSSQDYLHRSDSFVVHDVNVKVSRCGVAQVSLPAIAKQASALTSLYCTQGVEQRGISNACLYS